MQRLGYVDQEIKETKQKIHSYFYIGHRKYNTQNLGVPVGRRDLTKEIGMILDKGDTVLKEIHCLDTGDGAGEFMVIMEAGALTLGMKPASVTVVWGATHRSTK